MTADQQFYVIECAHNTRRFRVTDNLWTRDRTLAALTSLDLANSIAAALNAKYRDDAGWCHYETLRKIK